MEKIIIPPSRPVCRTPIKPVQPHRVKTKFARKPKHPDKFSNVNSDDSQSFYS